MSDFFFFSQDYAIELEMKSKTEVYAYTFFDDESLLLKALKKDQDTIVIADYDSVSHAINNWIASDTLPSKLIIMESVPNLATGRYLISHGIKAYANIRMQQIHFDQMLQTVKEGLIWTYPELTSFLSTLNNNMISPDAKPLLDRLTDKEKKVTIYILNGLTNAAIAAKMDITPRTIKAHITSIFNKLHVNDRISLVLLLKS
jgi:DNA-binding NarL/FixJ family response regulator